MVYKKETQSGQVALMALLVMTIAATVGLSLIARTTTDISVTRNTEESTRAFSAAEAGVEETLRSGVASSGTIDPTYGVSYTASITPVSGTATSPYVFPQKTLNEDTETVWLVSHSADGTIIESPTYTANTINVCWSSESTTPAIVVSILYKKASDGSYRVARNAYDSNRSRATDLVTGNNFSAPVAATGCPSTTALGTKITFSDYGIVPANDTLIALRIRPVYAGALLAVAPAAAVPAQNLPVQGNSIQSVGVTTSGVNRKITVYQQYRAPESIFDYALYSEGSLSQ